MEEARDSQTVTSEPAVSRTIALAAAVSMLVAACAGAPSPKTLPLVATTARPVAVAPAPPPEPPPGTFKRAEVFWQKDPDSGEMNWADAKDHCARLDLGGGGWRVPTKDELLALYESKSPADSAIPGMDGGWYWTSSLLEGESSEAWIVAFAANGSGNASFSMKFRVRCARTPGVVAAPAPAAPAPPARRTVSLEVGTMEMNGFKMRDLKCKIDQGGLLTTVTIVGGLAEQKAALKACGADSPKVTWTLSGAGSRDIAVTAKNPVIEKCVSKAMEKVKAAVEGTCSVELDLIHSK